MRSRIMSAQTVAYFLDEITNFKSILSDAKGVQYHLIFEHMITYSYRNPDADVANLCR